MPQAQSLLTTQMMGMLWRTATASMHGNFSVLALTAATVELASSARADSSVAASPLWILSLLR